MGEDKATMPYKGKPLAFWSYEALKPLCSDIIVSSNNLEHNVFGSQIVTDLPDIHGPLSGLTAALEASQTEINLVLACDNPNVTSSALQKLLEEMNDHDAAIAISPDGRIHPLIGCYRTTVLSTIHLIKETNRHSLMYLLDKLNHKKVWINDNSITLNVNAKKDLL